MNQTPPTDESLAGEAALPRRLSAEESRELAERLASLTAAGLPLADGLKAAADEAASARLRAVLRDMARHLDAGVSLEQLLTMHAGRLPEYLQAAIHAGIKTQRLPQLLTELVSADRRSHDIRREITTALAYPTLLLLMLGGLFLMVSLWIIPQMIPLYEDFDTQMPAPTNLLVSTSQAADAMASSWLIRGLVYCAILVAIVWCVGTLLWKRIGYRLIRGLGSKGQQMALALDRRVTKLSTWPSRLIATMPLIGAIGWWRNVAWWARLLATLIERDVPLPQALTTAARGVANAGVAESTRLLAPDVSKGRALADCIDRSLWLPASLVPIIRWGEATGELPEALRTAADMFEARASNRASMIKTVAPPVMFLVVATGGMVVVSGLFMPLLSLIRSLS